MKAEQARELAEGCYWSRSNSGSEATIHAIQQAILQACAEQKEADAQTCDDIDDGGEWGHSVSIAAKAIRRGE
jgi:hypothetical protein